jgi:hypothetical protein
VKAIRAIIERNWAPVPNTPYLQAIVHRLEVEAAQAEIENIEARLTARDRPPHEHSDFPSTTDVVREDRH